MGIGYITIGVIFLFNPMISLLDVLPDFIGYIFILVSIYKLADMTNLMDKIHRHILYLTAVSIARLVLSIVLVADDKVLSLIFVFVFAIIDAVFMISVFNKIFDGIEDIGMRFPNESVFIKLPEVKTFGTVFAIVRSLFTLIPEFRHLAMTDYEGEILSTEMLGRADYSYMLIILNVAVVTLVGLAWLGMTIGYLNRVRKDNGFIKSISEYYTNVILADNKRFVIRRIMISMIMIMTGFVFLIDIFFGNVDVLPDFIGGLFILTAFIFMRKENNIKRSLIFISIAYIQPTIANWILRVLFAGNEYHITHLQHSDVLAQYLTLIVLSLISSLFLAFMFFSINKIFTGMINDMVGIEHEAHFTRLIEQQKESILKKTQANKLILFVSIAFAVSKVIQTAAMMLLPEYWMVHFVIQIFWLFRCYIFVTNLYEEIKFRLGTGVEKI